MISNFTNSALSFAELRGQPKKSQHQNDIVRTLMTLFASLGRESRVELEHQGSQPRVLPLHHSQQQMVAAGRTARPLMVSETTGPLLSEAAKKCALFNLEIFTHNLTNELFLHAIVSETLTRLYCHSFNPTFYSPQRR